MPTLTGRKLTLLSVPTTKTPSTSLKLPGANGLRVDVLAPGKKLGATVKVPELQWSAQAVPHYDYLLAAPEPAAMLAGGHCIPIRLPRAGCFVWHKLYSSTQRKGFPEKAAKDREQALVLAAVLADHDHRELERAFDEVPQSMRKPIKPLAKMLAAKAEGHTALVELLRRCLDG